jgi:LytS/YehU family sensor histidine kinase
LLRSSLDAQRGRVVPLAQELKLVQDYLEIEQARLGRRLRYHVEANEHLSELAVPPLSVQTLVENSVKFAVAPNLEGGEIRVRADRTDNCLRIDVVDTGSGFSMDSVPRGHGLDNLRDRLSMLFGNAAQLSVERTSDGRTAVIMRVPV